MQTLYLAVSLLALMSLAIHFMMINRKQTPVLDKKKTFRPITNYPEQVFNKPIFYTVSDIRFDPLFTHVLVYKEDYSAVKTLLDGQLIDKPLTDGLILIKSQDKLEQTYVHNGKIRFDMKHAITKHVPDPSTLQFANALEQQLIKMAHNQ